MLNILIAALLAGFLYMWHPVPWVLITISILGFLIPLLVLTCVFIIGYGSNVIPIPSLKLIQEKLAKDIQTHHQVTELFMLLMLQIVNIMFFPYFVVTVFLGIGAVLTGNTLVRYMDKTYKKELNEALQYFKDDDNPPTGAT